jgi:hypothetical protein
LLPQHEQADQHFDAGQDRSGGSLDGLRHGYSSGLT